MGKWLLNQRLQSAATRETHIGWSIGERLSVVVFVSLRRHQTRRPIVEVRVPLRYDDATGVTKRNRTPMPREPERRASHVVRRRGFTLVELLVVITIIGILMSLLLRQFSPPIGIVLLYGEEHRNTTSAACSAARGGPRCNPYEVSLHG